MKKDVKEHILNHKIKTPQVRLTGEGFNGEIITLREALNKAETLEMDLVLFSETNNIGICKIINYEKFIYELSKKPKNKALEMKEIKLGPNMTENDLSYRAKHIQEFLVKGHRIKLSMRFKGREMMFVDKGKELMLKLIVDLENFGTAESLPKLEGKQLLIYLKPKPKK
jgi:translation initiation factor IF-3